VKARDGTTDLYGLMFKPTNLDPEKKYPIINHVYPGPQGGSVGSWGFAAARGDAQALAELGFVVVEIEGMGNPMRSKKFHDFYFANMGDNTLPDQIAGMKQLAQQNRWIDIDKAGIWATPAADMPLPTPCSAILTSSRSAFQNPATTTTANTKTIGASATKACLNASPTAKPTMTTRPTRTSPKT